MSNLIFVEYGRSSGRLAFCCSKTFTLLKNWDVSFLFSIREIHKSEMSGKILEFNYISCLIDILHLKLNCFGKSGFNVTPKIKNTRVNILRPLTIVKRETYFLILVISTNICVCACACACVYRKIPLICSPTFPTCTSYAVSNI